MSKTFREGYYGDDWGLKKIKKNSKHNRYKVKDYLKQIDFEEIEEDEELFEDFD